MIYFWLVLQQTIASMTHIVGQDAAHAVSPFVLLLFRASIAGVALYLFVAIKDKTWNIFKGITKADLGRLVIVGGLNILINQLLYLEGLQFTTPANSALLYALTPAMVFIFAIRAHWERTNWKKIAGIAVAFIGTAILMFERGASLASEHTRGNIMIFIAVCAWSLFTLLGRPLIKKYGALRVTAQHMFIGAVLYLPIGLFHLDEASVSSFTPVIWEEILYLGIVASCINYALWYYALGKLDTSKVAIFQNLQPVITTILAISLGRTEPTVELLGGGVLALAGILMVEYG